MTSNASANAGNYDRSHTGLVGVLALIFGGLAVVLSPLLVGFVFGLVALIVGLLHISRSARGRGFAWAGVGLGLVGMLMSVVLAIFYVSATRSLIGLARGGRAPENRFARWQGVVAPQLAVTTTEGETIRLSDLRGRRVVLNFWATWCAPCRKELPHLIALRENHSTSELVMLGISSEDAETLRPFIRKHGINYPVASASDEALELPWRDVSAIPTTFIIDRNGIILDIHTGYLGADELDALVDAADYIGEPKTEPESPPSGLSEPERPLIPTLLWASIRTNPVRLQMQRLGDSSSN